MTETTATEKKPVEVTTTTDTPVVKRKSKKTRRVVQK